VKKTLLRCFLTPAGLLALAFALTGCSTISEHTHAYLTAPKFAPTDPSKVTVLANEPDRAKDRLGEIRLSAEGEPPREEVEKRLQAAAAKLGADAVFLVYDKVHVYPVVYAGWYGPAAVADGERREIVAVAIKYK
jgi:hypothetical protein